MISLQAIFGNPALAMLSGICIGMAVGALVMAAFDYYMDEK